VWSRSAGQTRTTINYAKATFNALVELNKTRIGEGDRRRLHITSGRGGQ
ncbi:MAG: 30S ribosomal protein S5, partial [Candidatus Thermoplasmatota archaeon]|nr:30S ribosomal protein S5 [Candidatus Thermoplasmatota archaeon]